MRNQHGFAYPLTLIIVAILTLSCLYTIQLYEVEKRFVLEQEKLLQLDNLVQMGIIDYIKQSEKSEGIEERHYEVGSITFTTRKQTDEVVRVELHSKVGPHHKRWSIIHYNLNTDSMIYFQDMN
ncbi:competence type IV pilus minor pilin ComGG [Alkalicoccobacillus plakortidis]|uniref:ComGG family competence protein n=1 Tax=Alkalicoccobacillus plakortidis TaxID=444060 RepID=A0ABT0XIH5_9BACI|nr:competence type IV pilus minor pilin ComGG [Alkalicoccobacillus plakortidis]MCM2675012.1 ComGG family competence protein [Alkalicoccobacillus plakortidis]